MNPFKKKIAIGLVVLAVLSPAGIILPKLFKSGSPWGEWSVEEVARKTGSSPKNMEKESKLWKAPLKDYELNKNSNFSNKAFSYFLSGFIGVGIIAAGTFLWIKFSTKK